MWEIVGQFLIKLNIYLHIDPAILLLGIYPAAMKTGPHKELFMKF